MLVSTWISVFDDMFDSSSLKQCNTMKSKNLHKTFILLLIHFKMAV